jgi:glycosyltransferase involved in cell wall biosynthesis
MRVLHAVVNMNRGGAETLIMNIYRNVDRTRVQFDFLTCKEGVFDSEIMELGGRVHRIPYVTDVGHSGYKKALNKFFQQHKEYKIIHSHMDKMSGMVLKAAFDAGVPVRIAHSHNTYSEGGMAARTYKWFVGKQIKSFATHMYACSHAAAKWLYGDDAKNAIILKNGIEIEKYLYSEASRKKMRKALQISDNQIVFGHVGRFNEQKNHMFLLEIFSEVIKRLPNSMLILIGDGKLRKKIEEKMNLLHLTDKVKLLGVRDNVHEILQAFDFFLFPSFHEGLPVTLVEAQSSGLPCFISEHISEEVDLGVGLIHYLPITNTHTWVEEILKQMKRSRKREIYQQRLAQKGYDIKRTAQQTQKSYLGLGSRGI